MPRFFPLFYFVLLLFCFITSFCKFLPSFTNSCAEFQLYSFSIISSLFRFGLILVTLLYASLHSYWPLAFHTILTNLSTVFLSIYTYHFNFLSSNGSTVEHNSTIFSISSNLSWSTILLYFFIAAAFILSSCSFCLYSVFCFI